MAYSCPDGDSCPCGSAELRFCVLRHCGSAYLQRNFYVAEFSRSKNKLTQDFCSCGIAVAAAALLRLACLLAESLHTFYSTFFVALMLTICCVLRSCGNG